MNEWLRSLGFGDLAFTYAARLASHGIHTVMDLQRLRPVSAQLSAWGIDESNDAQRVAAALAALIDASDEGVPPSHPEGLEPGRLPVFLAHAWQHYWEERNSRLKLYLLLDLSELCIRFATAIAIGEAAAHAGGQLAQKVLNKLSGRHLTHPTFGGWCKILRETIETAWEANHPQRPAVAALEEMMARGDLKGRFDSGEEGGAVALESSVVALRNKVFHSGVTLQAARRLLPIHEPHLIKLMRELMAALDGRRVVAASENEWYDLTGLEPTRLAQEKIPPPTSTGETRRSGVFLLGDRGETISLWPVAVFEKIGHDGADRPTRAQLYSRLHEGKRDVEWVDYTPIGGDEMFSRLSHHADEFSRFFQLGRHSPRTADEAPAVAFSRTLQEGQPALEQIVGREVQAGEVMLWYRRKISQPGIGRIGWIGGPPGIGKSAFMAVTADYFLEKDFPAGHWGFFHRFQEGQANNGLLPFLIALRESLRQWEALRQVAPALPAVSKPGVLETENEVFVSVREQLQAIPRLAENREGNPSGAPTLIAFVDGVDECSDRSVLPQRLHDLALPGTCWIVAGRPDFNLEEAFRSIGAEFLLGENGLSGLTHEGVRRMFFNAGDQLYSRIRKLDRNFPDNEQVRNQFVQRVWEMSRDDPASAAGGNPQYVRLIIDDLAQRRYTVQDVVDNPRLLSPGLSAAYDRILQRLGVTDSSTLLPGIAAQLASAFEPLTVGFFVRLLAEMRPLLAGAEAGVKEALGWGRSLLRPLPTPEGEAGWAIQHQSFREHVSTTRWMIRTREECSVALARLIRGSYERLAGDGAADSGANYLLRHGIRHLLDSTLPTARLLLATLAADPAYLERKLVAHRFADQNDFAGFLDDLYDVHLALDQGGDDERTTASQMGGRVLEALLRDGLRTGKTLDPEEIHSLLIYRKPGQEQNGGFYEQLLSQVRDDTFWGRFADQLASPQLDGLRAGFLAKAANALRRRGPTWFAEAEGILQDCAARLEILNRDTTAEVPLRDLSRVEYDLGYLAALRGNSGLAAESFERSAVTAERAQHPAGAWVSRCVAALFKFYDDQDAAALLQLLRRALEIFQDLFHNHKNTLAQRWIANVLVHSFNAFYHQGDLSNARAFYQRALDDPWLRQQAWLVRDTKARGEPRLAVLEGRYEEAAMLFEELLATPGFPESESAAEHYWEYGLLLERSGHPAEAHRIWQSALADLVPENGNTYWLRRIQQKFGAPTSDARRLRQADAGSPIS